jgi:hypothetical protein
MGIIRKLITSYTRKQWFDFGLSFLTLWAYEFFSNFNSSLGSFEGALGNAFGKALLPYIVLTFLVRITQRKKSIKERSYSNMLYLSVAYIVLRLLA